MVRLFDFVRARLTMDGPSLCSAALVLPVACYLLS